MLLPERPAPLHPAGHRPGGSRVDAGEVELRTQRHFRPCMDRVTCLWVAPEQDHLASSPPDSSQSVSGSCWPHGSLVLVTIHEERSLALTLPAPQACSPVPPQIRAATVAPARTASTWPSATAWPASRAPSARRTSMSAPATRAAMAPTAPTAWPATRAPAPRASVGSTARTTRPTAQRGGWAHSPRTGSLCLG